jgi:hypothetical protein
MSTQTAGAGRSSSSTTDRPYLLPSFKPSRISICSCRYCFSHRPTWVLLCSTHRPSACTTSHSVLHVSSHCLPTSCLFPNAESSASLLTFLIMIRHSAWIAHAYKRRTETDFDTCRRPTRLPLPCRRTVRSSPGSATIRVLCYRLHPQVYRVCSACMSSAALVVSKQGLHIDDDSQALVDPSARGRPSGGQLEMKHGYLPHLVPLEEPSSPLAECSGAVLLMACNTPFRCFLIQHTCRCRHNPRIQSLASRHWATDSCQ